MRDNLTHEYGKRIISALRVGTTVTSIQYDLCVNRRICCQVIGWCILANQIASGAFDISGF